MNQGMQKGARNIKSNTRTLACARVVQEGEQNLTSNATNNVAVRFIWLDFQARTINKPKFAI